MDKTLFPLLLCALCHCGCSVVYLKEPLALSSQTGVEGHVERLSPVSVEWCDRVIVVVPLIDKESEHLTELLSKAKRAGGTAVVDVQVKETERLIVPFYGKNCWQIRGTAAKTK